MTKSKTTQKSSKTTFGKKRSGPGSAKKSYGPKDQKPKRYRSQGR
jgi:hypothetical protein